MARRVVRAGDFEATFTLSRRGRSSELDRRPARRLNPIVWTVVAVLTVWVLVIVFSSVATGGSASRWLISLPFLAVLVIAVIGVLAVDRYFHRRDLRCAVNAELQSLGELERRVAASEARLAQQSSRASRSGEPGAASETST